MSRGGWLVLVCVVASASCGRFSDGLQRDIALSRYHDAISRAKRWLGQHPAPASDEERAEALRVSQLLAQAETERAWKRGDADELARIQGELPATPSFAGIARQALEYEATLRYVDEVQRASSVARVQQFRRRFAGTPEADAARAVEVALAASAAAGQRSVEAERRFREGYGSS